MKKIFILISLISIIVVLGFDISFAGNNLGEGANIGGTNRNTILDSFSSGFSSFATGYGSLGVANTIIQIARDLKNIFFVVATVYFIIIVLRLLLATNTEEEVGKFKKGIVWITVGIIVMQLAYSFSVIIFGDTVNGSIASSLSNNILYPLIQLLETLASFIFIAIAVYSFYRIVTANGNEEAIKSGRMAIFYAIIGFVIIRFVEILVTSMYGNINCTSGNTSCIGSKDLSGTANIIITIINWMNGFVAIVVIIMIIYAGFNILLSGGDEEKVKKGKNTIIYIFIGLFILSFNYIILTFFL